MERPIRVFVADDHPVYRRGVARIVEREPGLELVGEADDGRAALRQIRAVKPDVAILDVEMPGLDGVDVLRQLQPEHPDLRVLFLSGHVESEVVYRALQQGAHGFLSKGEDEQMIARAVVAVARGDTFLGPDVQAAVAHGVRERAPAPEASPLSERELEILRLTAGGNSSQEIGRELHLSPATVKTHLGRIYGKLGVNDRAAAVAEGMRLGLFR